MPNTPERSANGRGALAGLRVIDLSRVLAGPLCTQMLADHGADVIKVEPPSGDETRTLGPPFNDDGDAAYFTAVNRGKRGIALNLAVPQGRETLMRLLEEADVLVENFIPGTMQRWGLDFEDELKPRFPGLIYCSISGFGADGPLGSLPGYDAVLQAMCGLMSINGEPSSGPTRMGIPIVDHLTGYTALTGILLALHHRDRTGLGQRVEATLFDSALSLLVPHAANWMHSDQVPGLLGSAHPNIAPYDKFHCQDGLVFLGIVNDRQFAKFCAVMELPALASDPRFAVNAARLEHRDALRQQIEAALSGWKRETLCSALMHVGVPVGPVHTVPEAFAQAHASHRAMSVSSDGYRGIGVPVRLSRTPGRPGRPPPRLDQHAQELLGEAP
ncbi:CaiB/BaiF CoA transferase family protein [Variovorax ginsengisoli]|uniref:CoA transferase n=1 Tax=Variovorax ginsengisoli TaxID=363844 RepID=A0ABT8S624_9BURK|nr:CoA transferase [Variovorax ginsengisoli]MDN8615090.1 CoA transferase [Variovorax ginsengisoli]MDO1534260.1 CoA transferase [Variovorax ginsengisoli]